MECQAHLCSFIFLVHLANIDPLSMDIDLLALELQGCKLLRLLTSIRRNCTLVCPGGIISSVNLLSLAEPTYTSHECKGQPAWDALTARSAVTGCIASTTACPMVCAAPSVTL